MLDPTNKAIALWPSEPRKAERVVPLDEPARWEVLLSWLPWWAGIAVAAAVGGAYAVMRLVWL
jgi:hypothetical protein